MVELFLSLAVVALLFALLADSNAGDTMVALKQVAWKVGLGVAAFFTFILLAVCVSGSGQQIAISNQITYPVNLSDSEVAADKHFHHCQESAEPVDDTSGCRPTHHAEAYSAEVPFEECYPVGSGKSAREECGIGYRTEMR